jgi:hypothetical protein
MINICDLELSFLAQDELVLAFWTKRRPVLLFKSITQKNWAANFFLDTSISKNY